MRRRVQGAFVSTHSRLKAAGEDNGMVDAAKTVSTHSRLKAAGSCKRKFNIYRRCFNTQPPEGGWLAEPKSCKRSQIGFNTQPPEGGWNNFMMLIRAMPLFQHTAA